MSEFTFFIGIFCGAASLAGGFIDAIAGGGGLLTMPALLICGVPPHIALGTNKIGALMGTSVALYNFTVSHLVKWRLVVYGLGFSLLGSWAGSLLALHLDANLLGKILVGLLPFAMLVTLIPQGRKKPASLEITGWKFWLLLPLICAAIGCYDGFFGPATGTFLILGLHWALGLGLIQSSATAKAFNLGSNFSAAVSFGWHGAVFWPLAILMAICLMTGNWLGSRLAIKIGAKAVRVFLIISLMLLLITLCLQYFF